MRDLIKKKYFEELCNVDSEVQIGVNIYCFDGEPINRNEVEVRMKKIKNDKGAYMNEVT